MQPLADERRDQHAAALRQVRADRFEMVDELRKQVVRERAEAREDDLVRSQRWRRFVVAVGTAGAGDGDVGVAGCGLAEGVLQELADLLVHRIERYSIAPAARTHRTLSGTAQRGRRPIHLRWTPSHYLEPPVRRPRPEHRWTECARPS